MPLTKAELVKQLEAARAEAARQACENEDLRGRLRAALVDLALANKGQRAL